MNYSDYDSDGYSSNEDEDYVPSEDNLSEDDITQCDREDPLEDSVLPPEHVSSKKRKKKESNVRKRRKNVLKEGETEEEKEEKKEEVETLDEEKQKKRSDDLWERFLQDVGPGAKGCPGPSGGGQKEAPPPSRTLVHDGAPAPPPAPPPAATVTITKVFDFAGEEVRVNKEVSADSREARSYQKSQSITQDRRVEHESCSTSQAPPHALSSKRPSGLSHLLGVMGGKKPKLSTLDKSRMDWDAFKSEEGITEELAIHNRGRDGYVERKNFLERVDQRQFEREKAVRLKNMKQ